MSDDNTNTYPVEAVRAAYASGVIEGQSIAVTPEQLARLFHETYERLAPEFGYKTREASAVPWEDVPGKNKTLMIAVAEEVRRATILVRAPPAADTPLGRMRAAQAVRCDVRCWRVGAAATYVDGVCDECGSHEPPAADDKGDQ